MFWLTFFISGLIVASIPWVASHFSNQVAGYLVLVPVMMSLSIITQFKSHGAEATTQMIAATLWALPTLAVFGISMMLLLKNGAPLMLALPAGLVVWLCAIIVVNWIN